MENQTPYEIIMAPFTIWTAPVGTAFPDLDEAPSGSWTKLGTSGDENYAREGVTVEHSEAIAIFRGLARTGPKKATRHEEDLKIRAIVADLTLETYKPALNGNSITTVVASLGVPGSKKIGLSKGTQVTQYALLVRGPSSYMADGTGQFEVPKCFQSGNPKPVFRNEEAAGLEFEFTALEDTSASTADERFGRLKMQTADALT